ncbi:uncharacterized protein y4fB-like [Oculina patagonica]
MPNPNESSKADQGAHTDQDQIDAILRHKKSSEHRFHEAHEGIFSGLWDWITECKQDALKEEALFSGELQSSCFLYEGFKTSRFIGKIHLQNGGQGTGTMVSKRLLLTALHVFKTCKRGKVIFERVNPSSSVYHMTEEIFKLEPERFFLAHPDDTLDIALIAVSERSIDGNSSLSDIGYCERVITSEKPGTHVNIIQFPQDKKQMVVLRENQILHADDSYLKLFDKSFIEHHRYKAHRSVAKKRGFFSSLKKNNCEYNLPFLRYTADTDDGSSGGPCFDDMWNLIGIHQCALSVQDKRKSKGFKYIANEGLKIGVVIDWVNTELAKNDSYDQEELGELFGGNM